MITIETCDGYFMLVDDTHGKVGIAQTKSRTWACRIRDALNANNTILGRRVREFGVTPSTEGVVVSIDVATCELCKPSMCITLLIRDDDGDLVECAAHSCHVIDPPCEAGAPIEAPRDTHIDSIDARKILNALRSWPRPHEDELPATLWARLEEIADGPTP